MDANAAVTAVAGNDTRGYVNGAVAGAQFNTPDDVAVGADSAIYVADTGNHAIRKIAGGMVSTLAGTGTTGFMDGAGASAQFAGPQGVAVHGDGRVFVADYANQRIRLIDASGTVSTLAGAGPEATPTAVDGPGASARFVGPARVAITSVGLAITDGNRLSLLFCR
jgi:sugar lactone lactonase YvrE